MFTARADHTEHELAHQPQIPCDTVFIVRMSGLTLCPQAHLMQENIHHREIRVFWVASRA
jgi:hypothetical protein